MPTAGSNSLTEPVIGREILSVPRGAQNRVFPKARVRPLAVVPTFAFEPSPSWANTESNEVLVTTLMDKNPLREQKRRPKHQSHIIGADSDLTRRAPGVSAPEASAPVVSIVGSTRQFHGSGRSLWIAGDTTTDDGGHFASAITGTCWRGLAGTAGTYRFRGGIPANSRKIGRSARTTACLVSVT